MAVTVNAFDLQNLWRVFKIVDLIPKSQQSSELNLVIYILPREEERDSLQRSRCSVATGINDASAFTQQGRDVSKIHVGPDQAEDANDEDDPHDKDKEEEYIGVTALPCGGKVGGGLSDDSSE